MWTLVEETTGEWLYRDGAPFARAAPWPADGALIAAASAHPNPVGIGEVRRITGTIFAIGSPLNNLGAEYRFVTTMF